MPPKRKQTKAQKESDPAPQKKIQTDSKKPQLKIPVDKYFSCLPDTHKVYQTDDQIFNCTLNQTNLGNNNNKFYIIQLLLEEATSTYKLFTRWGRVGVAGKHATAPFKDEKQAIKEYEKKKKAKSKGYTEIEINYDEEDEEEEEAKKKMIEKNKNQESEDEDDGPEPESKLPKQTQDLMRLIFDQNFMNKQLASMGFDSKKQPLGKLGDKTILQAYKVLQDLDEVIKNNKGINEIKNLSNKFYSLIPHDLGFNRNISAFILDTDKKITQKTEMLTSLADMKLSAQIMESKKKKEKENKVKLHDLDNKYQQLRNNIQPLDPKSQTYKEIVEYVKDGDRWGSGNRKIHAIYSLDKEGEADRFDNDRNKEIGNEQLLWHGSRLQNYGGILSQGLRIAPPEAPVNGYAYGKGLYFANAFCTSAGYSYNSGTNQSLILLCKVAVGKLGPLRSVHNPCIDFDKYDTCLGFSSQEFRDDQYTTVGGIKAPTKTGAQANNAYIKYRVDSAQLKYLIWYEN